MKILRALLKALRIAIVVFFSLIFLLLIILNIPAVQNYLVDKVTTELSNTLGYKVSIDKISFSWIDEVQLENITILDRFGNVMIQIDDAMFDINMSSIVTPPFAMDGAYLNDGQVNVIAYKKDSTVNISDFIARIQELTTPKVKRVGPPPPFVINQVKLNNMFFSYNDQRREKLYDMFDHGHFAFDSIHLKAERLRIVADTIQFSLHDLSTYETQTYFRVHELNTDFMLNKKHIELSNLYANAGHSEIRNYFKMSYAKIADVSTDFNNLVDLHIKLDSSTVDFKDLVLFAPKLSNLHERVKVTAEVRGTVSYLTVKNADLNFGKNSHIAGRLMFRGLPDLQNTFSEIKLKEIRVTSGDLHQYLDDPTWNVASKIGYVRGKGSFVGMPNDFVLNGEFVSELGGFSPKLQMQIYDDSLPHYKGSLTTVQFNIGKLLNLKTVSVIDMSGNIEGKGIKNEDADLRLDANITRININQYDYKNIVTNAKIKNEYFNGDITIRDPNLKLTAKGEVNMKGGQEHFDIRGSIDTVFMQPLRMTNFSMMVSTKFNLNFKGIHLDSIEGTVSLSRTYLVYHGNKELFLDTMLAYANKSGENRSFGVQSDLVDASVSGDFPLTHLYAFLKETYNEYYLNLMHTREEIDFYYAHKPNEIDPHRATFDIDAKNLNALFDIFVPGLYITEGTIVKGSLTSGYTNMVQANSHFEELNYKGDRFHNTDIDLSLSKIYNKPDILSMAYIESAEQNWSKVVPTQNLSLEAIWNGDTIDIDAYVKQKNTNNYLKLTSQIELLPDKNKISFERSFAFINNGKWDISKNGTIYMRGSEFEFTNFGITSSQQTLTLNGFLSEDPEKSALLNIENYNLARIHSVLETKPFTGILNAKIDIRNIYDKIRLDGEFNVTGLGYNNILLGDLKGNADWNQQTEVVDLKMKLVNLRNEEVDISGIIFKNPQTNKNEIKMDAIFNSADLVMLNPLLEGILSDIDGNVTGHFKIFGTLTEPHVTGKAQVVNGRFKIPYLGTSYTFNDNIYLYDDHISFKSVELYDYLNNVTLLNGGIYHNGFRDFVLDIRGSMRQFNVLNTTEEDNDLFYGKAFVTGNFSIFGPADSLKIEADARSNKGTRIYIPLTGEETVSQHEYIKFDNISTKKDKTDTIRDAVDLSGITMNFNLDITPDAYTEIIFDKRTGDIIRGNGRGNLRMMIDTRGDFNMYGTYTIVKGAYNYTLAGLFNKEFKLEPNSTISWNGDPYRGILNLHARYAQNVYLKPLFDSVTVATNKDLQKKYPVDVILNVSGNLMNPEIELDIDIKRYPSSIQISSGIAEFKSRIMSDENELNKQVFSLLILRSFTSYNSFYGVSAGGGNLSEMLSNQLSNFLSQVDENLQIDIDLGSLDKEALNTFQMRFSYSLMNDRLRISREGGFNNTQGNPNTNISNIAGEWTIEYMLTQDGKLRLKLYNRINQNSFLTNMTYNTNTSAGFSISHTQSFNSVSDLLAGKRKRFANEEAEKFMKALYEIEPSYEENPEEDEEEDEEEENDNPEEEAPSVMQPVDKPKEDE